MIKSQDNHVVCLTVSLQYKNMYAICTSTHNNVVHKITLDFQVKFKFLAVFSRKKTTLK